MDKRRQIIVRLLIALLVGSGVCVVAVFVAWSGQSKAPGFQHSRFLAFDKIRQIESAIEEYRQETGSLPASFADLEGMEEIGEFIENGVIRDDWDHPLVYSQKGVGYTVRSYGRDGKPGGAGLDSDLSTPATSFTVQPTFYQFVFEMPTGGMIAGCAVSGILAFLLTLVLMKSPDFTLLCVSGAVVKIVLTAIMTLMIASIMAALHFPPVGH